MPDVVRELLATPVAIEKLGARGISVTEADQVFKNTHRMLRNPKSRSGWPERRMLIGLTDGRRCLTLVVEQTVEPTSWLIVTGWESSDAERKMLVRR